MSLLDYFRARHIAVRADGPDLVLKGLLTPEILAFGREHKEAILAELHRQATPKPLNRRGIARQALADAGVPVPKASLVLQAAENFERDWRFLVKDHGYPDGWFLLSHTDNWLRLNCGKGIAMEMVDGEVITHWTLIDAPAEAAPPAAPAAATPVAAAPKNVKIDPVFFERHKP